MPVVVVPVVHGVGIPVAAELLVAGHLLLGEDGEHLQMGVQMDGPEFAPESPDLVGEPEERLPVQVAVAEASLQVRFRLHDLLAQLRRAFPHTLEEGFGGFNLLGGEVEPRRLFQNVKRPGDPIQLGGEGHAEPGSFEEALDLGRGQGTDLPVLKGGVGVVLAVLVRGLGRGGGRERQKGEGEE